MTETDPNPSASNVQPRPGSFLTGKVRGRGAGLNPTNRFESLHLHVLNDHLNDLAAECPDAISRGVQVRTSVLSDQTRSIINRVDSPDISFKWTVNLYRGCEHGCVYCYARPGHEYLGMSSGLDFETKIVAKHDGPRLLRDALATDSWRGESIVFSGVTDCYQPVERELGLMRECLKVCLEFRQSLSIITKNSLILRDLDLLDELRRLNLVRAAISITSLDNDLASKLEPRASAPRERLRAVRELSAAGIPVSVMTAPIIPGLNDREIPALLEAASGAGAINAGWVLLRLPWQVKVLFTEWLERHYPDRAAHVESLLRQCRGGELYDATAFKRMRGEGPVAMQIAQVFSVFAKRTGLDRASTPLDTTIFRRTMDKGGQGRLFA